MLLDAMQEYFDYRAFSLCGIPEITLLGTTDDWKQIRRRAEVFSEYDLGWWTSHLTTALDELVRASEGRADLDRWRSFFKIDNQSGGPFVSGWINDLFPYLTESFVDRTGGEIVRGQRTVRNAFLGRAQAATKSWKTGPTMGDFAQGLSRVPFVWEMPGRKLAMELVGGFTGVAQDPGTRALRTAIGWAVRSARS